MADFFADMPMRTEFERLCELDDINDPFVPPCKSCLRERRKMPPNVLLNFKNMMNAVDRCEEHVKREIEEKPEKKKKGRPAKKPAARKPARTPAKKNGKRKVEEPKKVLRELPKRVRKPSRKVLEQTDVLEVIELLQVKEPKKATPNRIKYICPTCSKSACSGSCLCHGCRQWIHLKCAGLTAKKVPVNWHCAKCN